MDHKNSLTDGLRLLLTVRQRMFVSILPTNQVREPSELIDSQNSRLHIKNNPFVTLSICRSSAPKNVESINSIVGRTILEPFM